MISNQATPRIIELYESLGFELTYLDGPRRISCTGDRTAAREVLAIKKFRRIHVITQMQDKAWLPDLIYVEGQFRVWIARSCATSAGNIVRIAASSDEFQMRFA